jgi:hypothetical protein
MYESESRRPEPSGSRGRRPPDRRAASTGEQPRYHLVLTCVTCGHEQRVRARGDWQCPGGATHTRVRVQAVTD